ncbi:IS91 family transposase [bacterium]|nr:IS91 family transposase [bacterium]
MKDHWPEVADVIRECGSRYFKTYGSSTSLSQRRVMKDISLCRTAALGGHKDQCDKCGHEVISYNSCRNRHCPKCQGAAQAQWLEAREADLLNVPYFHVVFTLPHELGSLALQNKRLIYGILFRAASETLLTIAGDPKHLGAKIGFHMILHTWGQTLIYHPRVHVVVPGGGLSLDQTRWISSRKGFFLPVRVLSSLFRKKFLFYLKKSFREEKLSLHGQLRTLSQSRRWRDFIKNLEKNDWVVYAKPPFGSPEQVLKYLARYTHRVAISNRRLLSLRDGKVTFRYKDYSRQDSKRTITLQATEFIRRFLLHVLPKRFMRIRHYGLLANRGRKENLALCRSYLGTACLDSTPVKITNEQEQDKSKPICPVCGKGYMIRVEAIPKQPKKNKEIPCYLMFDTS